MTNLVSIHSSTGIFAGSGILVGQDLVLTCAHVVNSALGRSTDETTPPDTNEQVEVQFAGSSDHPLKATIDSENDAWRAPPADRAKGADICLLRLETQHPEGATVAILDPSSLSPSFTAPFDVTARGYPIEWIEKKKKSKPQADASQGYKIQGVDRHLWFMRGESSLMVATAIRKRRSAGIVHRGYSGGPVESSCGKVVGMVAQARTDPSDATAYVIPASSFPKSVLKAAPEIVQLSKSSLFLSYARTDDEPFVERLYRDLTERGLDLWLESEKMPNRGPYYRSEIREAVTRADRLLVIMGPGALESDDVCFEWEHALSICKPVIPILRMGDQELLPDKLKRLGAHDFLDDAQYGAKLADLLRQLNIPVAPLGYPLGVPSLPDHFVPRPDDLKDCKDLLLTSRAPVAITEPSRKMGLQGMGGVGKTILASEIAWDCDVRRVFPDGIFWVRLGQKPDLAQRQAELCRELGEPLSDPNQERKWHLQKILAKKACLVILDDVWDVAHAQAFDVPMPRGSLLVTTRNSRVVYALGAQEKPVGVLTDEQALDLLAKSAGVDVVALPPEAREVIRECGKLALAVAVVGGMVRKQPHNRWANALNRLRNAELDRIKILFPEEIYPYPNLMRAIQVSVDALEQDESLQRLNVHRHFLDLAVFREDTLIPEATLQTFWEPDGLSECDTQDVIDELVARSLLLRDEANFLILHDLTRDYVCKQFSAERLSDAHNRLLMAYRQKCPDGWHACPDDGYIFKQLAYHLSAAGRSAELCSLLTDATFLRTKIRLLDTSHLLLDFEQHLPNHSDGQRIAAALRLGARVLDRDPAELSNQLYGRLGTIPSLHNLPLRELPSFSLLSQTLTSPDRPSLSSLKGHKGSVHCCSFDPEGQRLVSASADSTLRVWNVHTGKNELLLEGHAGSVNGCAFDGRGERIASASDDRTLRVWEAQTGKLLRELAGHQAAVRSCSFSPLNHLLVSASDDWTVRLWDLRRDEKPRILDGHENGVRRCIFSPDGSLVVTASDDCTLRIWDVQKGVTRHVLEGHENAVHGCAFSPDGNLIASASDDRTVRIWNAETGAPMRVLAGHKEFVHGCAFSPDGMRLLSASSDRTLRLWDVATGEVLSTIEGHETWVNDCAFSPHGDMFASTCYDGSLRLWDAKDARVVIEMPTEMNYLRGCAFDPSGEFAFDADRIGLHVWRQADWLLMRVLEGHTSYVSACAVSPDGGWVLSASADNTLRVWDTRTWQTTQVLQGHGAIVYGCAVSADGRWALSASGDRTLCMWDTSTWQVVHRLLGHAHHVRCCAFSPDSRLAVSTSWDKTARIWDVKSGEALRTLESHGGNVRGCAFSRDGRQVLTASYDKTLRLWDVESGRPVREFMGHKNWVFDCAFVSDQWMISVSDDMTLKLWAIDEVREAAATWHADAPLTCCAVQRENDLIIAGDSLGSLHVLRLDM